MKRIITTALLAVVMSVCSQAAVVTFNLTGSDSGSPISFTGSGSENGVNFVSSLELSALAGSLLVDNNGTGVFGGSSFEINAGEGVDFAAPTITSATGGTAVFQGFQSITFSEFHTGDTGTVNGSLVNANGTIAVAGSPTTIALRGTGDAPPSDDGFQVTQVTALFTTTAASAVPEPSSLAALLVIGGCTIMRRRRKN